MKKRSLVLSLLCLMGIIFLMPPTLAQNLDDGWTDEEVAPPPPGPLPPAPSPAPAPRAVWGGRWHWTASRMIRPEDLESLSLEELELMRNEIYARNGWIFNRPDLRNYFESQPWYRPKGDPSNPEPSNRLVQARLTPLERRNIKVIVERERALRR